MYSTIVLSCPAGLELRNAVRHWNRRRANRRRRCGRPYAKYVRKATFR